MSQELADRLSIAHDQLRDVAADLLRLRRLMQDIPQPAATEALLAAESALAIKASLRDVEQAKVQAALEKVRAVLNAAERSNGDSQK